MKSWYDCRWLEILDPDFSNPGSRTKYPDPIGSFPGNVPTAHNQFGPRIRILSITRIRLDGSPQIRISLLHLMKVFTLCMDHKSGLFIYLVSCRISGHFDILSIRTQFRYAGTATENQKIILNNYSDLEKIEGINTKCTILVIKQVQMRFKLENRYFTWRI